MTRSWVKVESASSLPSSWASPTTPRPRICLRRVTRTRSPAFLLVSFFMVMRDCVPSPMNRLMYVRLSASRSSFRDQRLTRAGLELQRLTPRGAANWSVLRFQRGQAGLEARDLALLVQDPGALLVRRALCSFLSRGALLQHCMPPACLVGQAHVFVHELVLDGAAGDAQPGNLDVPGATDLRNVGQPLVGALHGEGRRHLDQKAVAGELARLQCLKLLYRSRLALLRLLLGSQLRLAFRARLGRHQPSLPKRFISSHALSKASGSSTDRAARSVMDMSWTPLRPVPPEMDIDAALPRLAASICSLPLSACTSIILPLGLPW